MMKQIAYVDDLYINRLKIKSIAHDRDDVDIFLINRDNMDLVGSNVDTLYEEIEHLVRLLSGN